MMHVSKQQVGDHNVVTISTTLILVDGEVEKFARYLADAGYAEKAEQLRRQAS